MGFPLDVRLRVLRWSDRHCCLCKKSCGVNIEAHHIDHNSKNNDIDNAIPLCFECHGEVAHYDDDHPRGTKFHPEELKDRREQVYEEFTSHLVPRINYGIRTTPKGFPDVGFFLEHASGHLPVRVEVKLKIKAKQRDCGPPPEHPFYDGRQPWHLNPGLVQTGHFALPAEIAPDEKPEIVVYVSIQDIAERKHPWLPVAWKYSDRGKDSYWYLLPSPNS